MYVIDGHNLIPKVPGLSLRSMDDEEQLIAMLQIFARLKHKKIEVFFDRAPVGQSGARPYGLVTAHFVIQGKTADEAIRQYLVGLGKAAPNATVITSDRQVQANARALHAQVIPSEDFARTLVEANRHWVGSASDEKEKPSAPAKKGGLAKKGGFAKRPAPEKPSAAGKPTTLTSHDLDEFLDMFGVDPSQANTPIEPPQPVRKGKKKKSKG